MSKLPPQRLLNVCALRKGTNQWHSIRERIRRIVSARLKVDSPCDIFHSLAAGDVGLRRFHPHVLQCQGCTHSMSQICAGHEILQVTLSNGYALVGSAFLVVPEGMVRLFHVMFARLFLSRHAQQHFNRTDLRYRYSN